MLALICLSLLAAPKVDARLVGSWTLNNAPFLALKADGTGVMEEDTVKWKADGKTLELTDNEGTVDKVAYQLQDDALTISMGGIPITLMRAGKAQAPAVKQGKFAQRLEAAQEAAPAPPVAQPRQQAGNDQLSALLLSSAWCHLRYNQAAGTSHTTKVRFNANGTWNDFSEHDIYVNNSLGSAQSTSNSQSGGQWAVKQGQLYMSEGADPMQPLPLTVTRNSNGSPIINADGREYSMCN